MSIRPLLVAVFVLMTNSASSMPSQVIERHLRLVDTPLRITNLQSVPRIHDLAWSMDQPRYIRTRAVGALAQMDDPAIDRMLFELCFSDDFAVSKQAVIGLSRRSSPTQTVVTTERLLALRAAAPSLRAVINREVRSLIQRSR